MARPRISLEMAVAVVSSLVFHGAWIAQDAKASHARHEEKPAEVLLEAETVVKPPEPPKEEPQPEPTEQPKAEPPPVARNPAPRPQAAAVPPPSPAQAGKTLTAPEADNEPSDIADFTMVQGVADSYAGGTTSTNGRSAVAVRGPVDEKGPAATKARPAASAAPAVVGPDRSRTATPATGDWNCSRLFPTDPEAGDQAAVLIAVTVLADGSPRSVSVLRDPGHGFGAAAKACALAQRFNPAFDRDGNPVAATTPPITVRFTR